MWCPTVLMPTFLGALCSSLSFSFALSQVTQEERHDITCFHTFRTHRAGALAASILFCTLRHPYTHTSVYLYVCVQANPPLSLSLPVLSCCHFCTVVCLSVCVCSCCEVQKVGFFVCYLQVPVPPQTKNSNTTLFRKQKYGYMN